MNIAVDLDGTLCVEQSDWLDYHKSEPIYENIDKINRLFDEGHHITIWTSRFLSDEEITQAWLKNHGVKCHRLILEKPRFDLYLDNNSKRMENV